MKTRTYLDVRFDVTDLNKDERGRLAMEVAVQHESTDADSYRDLSTGKEVHVPGKPDIPYPEIEWNEVDVEEEPVYSWIGWEDGDEVDPPEPGKQWLTITEDGEEMAVIVHRHTGRNDGELMAQKIRRAQHIVEALDAAQKGWDGPSPAIHDHAASKAGQEPVAPAAFGGGPYVLTVCLDGIPQARDFDAKEEAIDAIGEAIIEFETDDTRIVTLLLSLEHSEYRGGQEPLFLDARGAAHILFGDQIDDLDFDPHTAQFLSGADVCASLAAHFNLTDDEYKSLR